MWSSHKRSANPGDHGHSSGPYCEDKKTDLEKAASGVSGACGHFVENPAILRTF